jgi:hypothetical protein
LPTRIRGVEPKRWAKAVEAERTLERSAEGAEVVAEAGWVAAGQKGFQFAAETLPDGDSTGEEFSAVDAEAEPTATVVGRVACDFEQAAACERLQRGGQGGAVHAQQIGHRRDARRVRAIERHEERKLAVGEVKGAEGFVEAAGESAGGALDMEAEAEIANPEAGFEREGAKWAGQGP